MLDAQLLETIRSIIHARAPDRHDLVTREFKQAVAAQAASGGIRSGAMKEKLNSIAGTEIRARIKEAQNKIQQAVGELHICFSHTLAADMKHELAIHAREAHDAVRDVLLSFAPHIFQPEFLRIDTPYQRALTESNSELDFFVAKLQATQRKQAMLSKPNTNIVNVHAPSIVQIGDNATANLTLINNEAKEAVSRSLKACAKFLKETNNVPRAANLIQIVDEAQVEVRKTNPDNTKLFEFLQILASAFQGMASGGQVYELIRNAITLFGR
jgi:hypothetical protein